MKAAYQLVQIETESGGRNRPRKRVSGHNKKYNDKGIYYVLGMGCSSCNNCFECIFPVCHYNESDPDDKKCLANPGDGITP